MNPFFKEIESKAIELSFSGVISIFQADKELFNKAFSLADIPNRHPNTPSTKFGIASGTKLFTALGIGKLIDEERLTLQTTIHEIFQSDLTWISPQATIQHLLMHTSGIFDYYDEEVISDFDHYHVDIPWYQLETPSDYLPLFSQKPLKFHPGERFSYSNGGYICLGIIIEKITRKLYRDHIQEVVFNPAKMVDSGYFAFNNLPNNTANGYRLDKSGNHVSNIYNLPIRGASDGGAYITTHDLRSFWDALNSNLILSEVMTTQFLSPQVNIKESLDYGYGLYISKVNDNSVFTISGSDAGVGFVSRYFPDRKLLINIISNKTDGEVGMHAFILDQLPMIDLE
ncbi:serine hydrolase domain-containing protein [Chloroflexota bacterium]